MPKRRRPPDEGRLIQGVYYAYVLGSALARAIPERLAYGLAAAAGTVWARLSTRRRAIVARNLSRVTALPVGSRELNRLVLEAFRSYARYWLETFRLVREGRDYFLDRFECRGEEQVWDMLKRGKGAIVVVGHLGNWDAAGAWVAATGHSIATIVEELRPRRMFEFFAEHRGRLGMTIYPARRGITEKLVEEVEKGSVVAIVGDRDLRGSGPEVTFFGERATLPGGPAALALRTGVPLLVGGVYSIRRGTRRGWYAQISEPLELPADPGPGAAAALTQQVARKLEEAIAHAPTEWHVFQPFWPADRRR